MSSQLIVNEFNDKVVEFLKQSSVLCQRMNNTSVTASDIAKIEGLNMIEPDFLIRLCIRQILKYKDKIDTYDYAFPDKFDVKSLSLTDLSITAVSKYISFMKLFKKLNADNKEVLFDYLQLFCCLALKYAEINILKTAV